MSRLEKTKKRILNLKTGQQKLLKLKSKQKKRANKTEQSMQPLRKNIKQPNIHIIGILKSERKQKGQKKWLKK